MELYFNYRDNIFGDIRKIYNINERCKKFRKWINRQVPKLKNYYKYNKYITKE